MWGYSSAALSDNAREALTTRKNEIRESDKTHTTGTTGLLDYWYCTPVLYGHTCRIPKPNHFYLMFRTAFIYIDIMIERFMTHTFTYIYIHVDM